MVLLFVCLFVCFLHDHHTISYASLGRGMAGIRGVSVESFSSFLRNSNPKSGVPNSHYKSDKNNNSSNQNSDNQ